MKYPRSLWIWICFSSWAVVVSAQQTERTITGDSAVLPYFTQVARYVDCSRDGRRIAAVLQTGSEEGIFVSGWAGVWFKRDMLEKTITFSPDSQRLACIAVDTENRQFVIVDQSEKKKYERILAATLTFRPDSRHLGYVAQTGTKQILVLDEEEKKEYEGMGVLGGLVFSPDSKRLAYRVQSGAKQFVVVDGIEQPAYDAISLPAFGPDGSVLAYAVQKGKQWSVTVNDIRGNSFSAIIDLGVGIVFDGPDSFHYLALQGGDLHIIDEKLQK